MTASVKRSHHVRTLQLPPACPFRASAQRRRGTAPFDRDDEGRVTALTFDQMAASKTNEVHARRIWSRLSGECVGEAPRSGGMSLWRCRRSLCAEAHCSRISWSAKYCRTWARAGKAMASTMGKAAERCAVSETKPRQQAPWVAGQGVMTPLVVMPGHPKRRDESIVGCSVNWPRRRADQALLASSPSQNDCI